MTPLEYSCLRIPGPRSLAGYGPRVTESDRTEVTSTHTQSCSWKSVLRRGSMAGTLAVSRGQKQACLGPETAPWGPCTLMPSQKASARPIS